MVIVMASISRLTAADLANLATEAPDTPMHQAVLAVADGATLLDAAGRVRIDDVRAHFESRLERLPELRRRLRPTWFPLGTPTWEDDPQFAIENHVRVASLASPGGLQMALAFAEAEMGRLMDRTRPLWEVWFLERYGEGQVGLLIKLHHAIADGPAMVNMLAQLFDLEPATFERPAVAWTPARPATTRELVADNALRKLAGLRRAVRALAHPVARGRAFASTVRATFEGMRQGRGAPRTSLNRPIAPARRLGCVELDLAAVKAVAHAHDVKLNDVFLAGVAAACRDVLLSRGEKVDGLRLRASMAVSMHADGDATRTGNRTGTEIVPLPLDVADPVTRVGLVAAATAKAKWGQQPVISSRLMVLFAKTGLTRLYIRRQHLMNVLTTNLPGPPLPLYFAGARMTHAVAIPPIAGNVTVSFAALSYAGRLTLSVIADAASWPDLDVLVAGLRASWAELEATAGTGALARSA